MCVTGQHNGHKFENLADRVSAMRKDVSNLMVLSRKSHARQLELQESYAERMNEYKSLQSVSL
jgi:hypothetical protein